MGRHDELGNDGCSVVYGLLPTSLRENGTLMAYGLPEKQPETMEACMSIPPCEPAVPSLAHVAAQFAYWRQQRAHPSERIPQTLWEQAVALTRALSYSHVAKHLRLSPSDLKQQMQAPHTTVCQAPASPLPLVEVPPAPAVAPTLPATEIELQRADGARLRLRTDNATLPLAAVVRAFLEEA